MSKVDVLAAMATYVTVVDIGTFSGAARRLKVGQSTVSKVIARLERRLGVHLLDRSPRGLMPTAGGQVFYEHARALIVRARNADRATRAAGPSLLRP